MYLNTVTVLDWDNTLWWDVLLQTKPLTVEDVECHAQIVKELKERDEHDKIQGRETTKRSLKSGEPNDPVDVDLSAKRLVLLDH